MPTKFTLYIGITEKELHKFNQLFEKHAHFLDPFPTMLHKGNDMKAAIFNTWLRYLKYDERLILKTNRFFTHTTVDVISLKMKNMMPQYIKEQFLVHYRNMDFTFIFSYFLTQNLVTYLENFLQANDEYNIHIQPAYYFIEDNDVSMQDGMFILLKKITYEFVNEYLTEHLITYIYHKALLETVHTLNEQKLASSN